MCNIPWQRLCPEPLNVFFTSTLRHGVCLVRRRIQKVWEHDNPRQNPMWYAHWWGWPPPPAAAAGTAFCWAAQPHYKLHSSLCPGLPSVDFTCNKKIHDESINRQLLVSQCTCCTYPRPSISSCILMSSWKLICLLSIDILCTLEPLQILYGKTASFFCPWFDSHSLLEFPF